MKRIAILIGSPSHPDTPEAGKYLPGVKTDIENIYRFLTSSIGGSWQENEIKIFPLNPTYIQVKPYLQECENADLAFVYFSGHGGTDTKNNSPRVQFRYNDNPYVKDLANRAKRQITIIDACRGYSEYRNFVGESVGLGKINFTSNNPQFARKLYDSYLQKIPEERRVLFFASQHNQNSQDTGMEGGLFSISLLNTVKTIIVNKKTSILNVEQIFAETAKKMKYKKHQPDLHFNVADAQKLPFAVKTNSQLQQTDKKNNIIGDIASGVLIGTAVVGGIYLISSVLSGKK